MRNVFLKNENLKKILYNEKNDCVKFSSSEKATSQQIVGAKFLCKSKFDFFRKALQQDHNLKMKTKKEKQKVLCQKSFFKFRFSSVDFGGRIGKKKVSNMNSKKVEQHKNLALCFTLRDIHINRDTFVCFCGKR